MTDHPVVVIDHPIANKTPEAVQTLALNNTGEIAKGLVS